MEVPSGDRNSLVSQIASDGSISSLNFLVMDLNLVIHLLCVINHSHGWWNAY